MLDDNSQVMQAPRAQELEVAEPNRTPEKKWGFRKASLGMAICCGVPLLLLAAASVFGLAALASGALSLAAIAACPVGMYFMMRYMSKN